MPTVKKIKQHKILLDTHVWIWLMLGSNELSKDFIKSIQIAQENENILISPISIWEIGMLEAKNKIRFDRDCQDWIDHALNQEGIKLTPITPRIAIQSSRLPGDLHGDPADRLLIATAHEENAVLVSCDSKIIDYGVGKFFSVHDPR